MEVCLLGQQWLSVVHKQILTTQKSYLVGDEMNMIKGYGLAAHVGRIEIVSGLSRTQFPHNGVRSGMFSFSIPGVCETSRWSLYAGRLVSP